MSQHDPLLRPRTCPRLDTVNALAPRAFFARLRRQHTAVLNLVFPILVTEAVALVGRDPHEWATRSVKRRLYRAELMTDQHLGDAELVSQRAGGAHGWRRGWMSVQLGVTASLRLSACLTSAATKCFKSEGFARLSDRLPVHLFVSH